MSVCTVCDAETQVPGARTYAFNWQASNDGTNVDLAPFARTLVPTFEAKKGTIFNCARCSANWFLTADGMMRRIPDNKKSIFADWCDSTPHPSSSQHVVLASIAGVAFLPFNMPAPEIHIPATVTRSDGTIHEQSLVVISDFPPISPSQSNTILGSDDLTFGPSRFSLPLSIRTASYNAHEVRMAVAPTRVESHDGTRYFLNGPTNFFKHVDVTGPNIKLSKATFQLDDAPFVHEDRDNILYVYYDHYSDDPELAKLIARDRAPTKRRWWQIWK
jgi:hypothetical protein